MNIFMLDTITSYCAEMHCDQHVSKMIVEYAQMLSSAHRLLDGDEYADRYYLYKVTHKNHPSTVWVRTNKKNYMWLNALYFYLRKEYTHRYKKVHASSKLGYGLSFFPKNIPDGEMTELPQCMPEKYKGNKDPMSGYRNYYLGEKSSFAKWSKGRSAPEWWI